MAKEKDSDGLAPVDETAAEGDLEGEPREPRWDLCLIVDSYSKTQVHTPKQGDNRVSSASVSVSV